MDSIKRLGTVATVTAGTVLVGAGSAFAAPAPPDSGDAVVAAGDALSTGVIDTTVDLIPYAVPVLLLAWGFSVAKGMIGTRKKKAS
jgi:hypothetical protein